MSTAVSFLAWGMLDFAKAYTTVGLRGVPRGLGGSWLSAFRPCGYRQVAAPLRMKIRVTLIGNHILVFHVWARAAPITRPPPTCRRRGR